MDRKYLGESRITLFKAQGIWQAEFSGMAAWIVQTSFGSTTLPTPYRETAKVDEVRAMLEELNPGVEVVVQGELDM